MLSDYEASGTQTRKLCMLPSALGEGEGGAGLGKAGAWRSVDWLVLVEGWLLVLTLRAYKARKQGHIHLQFHFGGGGGLCKLPECRH